MGQRSCGGELEAGAVTEQDLHRAFGWLKDANAPEDRLPYASPGGFKGVLDRADADC